MNNKDLLNPDLEPLLNPKSIAFIGVTPDIYRLGGIPLRYLLNQGYKGKIFPVNPKYKKIAGLKCYPSILDIPEDIDTTLILISAKGVLEVLEKCSEKGVKSAIIFSSGFAETGDEGRQRQHEIKEFVKRSGLRICGPNTDGLANVVGRIPLGFGPSLETLIPGKIGLVTQSGALMNTIVYRAQDRGLGFSYTIACGNEVDLESSDYIRFMIEDSNTKVIIAHIEGFKDTNKFLTVADLAVKKKKPIIILKVGSSHLGKKATAAHTGAFAGSDLSYDAIFKQKGVIRVDDFDHVVGATLIFLKCKLPKGDGVGIVSVTGGATGIMADKGNELGLNIPALSAKTKEELSKILRFGTAMNPFDLTGQIVDEPELVSKSLNLFTQDENIDVIVVVVPPFPSFWDEQFILDVVKASKITDKPFIILGPRGKLREKESEILEKSGLPVTYTVDECLKGVKALIRYSQYLKKYKHSQNLSFVKKPHIAINVEGIKDLLSTSNKTLTEHESKKLLSQYGIPVVKESVATSLEEAIRIANRIGYPLVLKINSPQIVHKSDADAIRLNINTESELIRYYQEVVDNSRKYDPKAEIRGVLVQEFIQDGIETIVGMSHDSQFGPTIVFGLGGIFVEVLEDVSLRVAPITEDDAKEMIKEIKGFKILQGFRGKPKADIKAIVDVLLKISNLSMDLRDLIFEIDVNPLIVLEEGKGVKAADALVVLGQQ